MITKEQILKAVDHLSSTAVGPVWVHYLADELGCTKQTVCKHLLKMEDELHLHTGRRDAIRSCRRLTAEEKIEFQKRQSLHAVCSALEGGYEDLNPYIRPDTDDDGNVTGDLMVNLELPALSPDRVSRLLQVIKERIA